MRAVEIHDAGILVSAESGLVADPSPGYAVLDGEAVLTGAAAWEVARLKPRRVNNRFWSELGTEPLPHPFPSGVTHADLAHAHLSRIWEEIRGGSDEVLLAVPATLSEAQLGLLLGIARAVGITVRGLVDTAVAAGVTVQEDATLLHLDLQLHRAVLTELRNEGALVRGHVEVEDAGGFVSIQDAWARRVAELFVQQTRFDPFHGAETEQALYQRLPRWITELRRQPEIEVSLSAAGRDYALRVSRAQLIAAAAVHYERLVQLVKRIAPVDGTAAVVSSHRIDELPGLAERLGQIVGREPVNLGADAAGRGALAARRRIRTDGASLPFVTALPRDRDASSVTGAGPTATDVGKGGRRPTHLVHAGQAHPIDSDPLVLGVAVEEGPRSVRLGGSTAGISRRHCSVRRDGRRVVVEDHSTYGTLLNGKRIEGRAELRAGDRLRLGHPGVELQLIALASDDGPA